MNCNINLKNLRTKYTTTQPPPPKKKTQWFHLFLALSSAAPCYKPWTLLYTPAAVPWAESPIPSSQSGHSTEVVGMEKKWRSTKLLEFDVCFKNQITNKTRFLCVYLLKTKSPGVKKNTLFRCKTTLQPSVCFRDPLYETHGQVKDINQQPGRHGRPTIPIP